MSEYGHADADAALRKVHRVDLGDGKHVFIRGELSGEDLSEAIEGARADDGEKVFRACWLFLANEDGSRRFPKDCDPADLDKLCAWPVSVLVRIAQAADRLSGLDEDHEGN